MNVNLCFVFVPVNKAHFQNKNNTEKIDKTVKMTQFRHVFIS